MNRSQSEQRFFGSQTGKRLHDIEAVLFDIDGTLARSPLVELIVRTAGCFGVDVGSDEVRRLKLAGQLTCGWRAAHELVRSKHPAVPFAEVRRRFELLYQGSADAPGLHLYEQLEPELAVMRQLSSLPLGIVTGRPTSDALRFLLRFELRSLMRVVVCREDYAPELKPHPRPIELALWRLGIKASHRVWYVGDTPEDMHCAVQAGVSAVGMIAHGDDPHLARAALAAAGACRVLSRIEEL